jgi:hypothetical protein
LPLGPIHQRKTNETSVSSVPAAAGTSLVRAATRGQNAGPCRLDADHGARGESGQAGPPLLRTGRTAGPSVRPRILSDGGSLRPVDGAPRAHPAAVEAFLLGLWECSLRLAASALLAELRGHVPIRWPRPLSRDFGMMGDGSGSSRLPTSRVARPGLARAHEEEIEVQLRGGSGDR